MSDLVGNLENWFSCVAAQIITSHEKLWGGVGCGDLVQYNPDGASTEDGVRLENEKDYTTHATKS